MWYGPAPLTGRGIQHAESEVAVRLERAHTQCFGQGEGLPVMIFGQRGVRGAAWA